MNIVAKKAFASRRCKKRARLAIPCWRRAVAAPLEQAPKKLIDFFDKRLLQHFDFEQFLIVRTIPFERKALAVDRIEAPDWWRGASATARTARADSPPSPPPTAFHAEGRGLAKTGRVGSGRKIVLPAITQSTARADAFGPRPRRRERVRAAPRPSKAPDSALAPG